MYRLRKDISTFLATIPNNVTVVAATKYVGPEDMRAIYQAGVHCFGENRVESFLEKYEALKDIEAEWHFIGHLQRNKAKEVITKLDVLESLDSIDLAKIIERERTTPLKCFVEVSMNLEESKNGVPHYALLKFLEQLVTFKKVELVGFMMMAKKESTHYSLLEQFESLKELRDKMEEKLAIKIPYLSMGMSDDYKEAIEASATHIRLGRILWRN